MVLFLRALRGQHEIESLSFSLPFLGLKIKSFILRLHVNSLRNDSCCVGDVFNITLADWLNLQLCGQTFAMMIMHPNEHPDPIALILTVVCKQLN